MEWIVNFGHIGILSLVLYQKMKIDNIYLTISQMEIYIITILIVLLIHAWTCTNPYKYMFNVMEVLPRAIATSSSLAALPLTSRCLEEKNKINPKVVALLDSS